MSNSRDDKSRNAEDTASRRAEQREGGGGKREAQRKGKGGRKGGRAGKGRRGEQNKIVKPTSVTCLLSVLFSATADTFRVRVQDVIPCPRLHIVPRSYSNYCRL